MADFLRKLLPERWQHRLHISDKVFVTKKKIWDIDFYLNQLRSQREAVRRQYDTVKEQTDAPDIFAKLIRRLGLKEAQEAMKDLDNARHKMEELPEKELAEVDATIVANLDKKVEGGKADLQQLEKQLETIDQQIESPGGVVESMANLRSVQDSLRQYRKRI